MLRITKNRFYVVPVLMRTLDILEFLGETDCSLRMNEISAATGVPPTTTYRILRTLVHRGYLAQDLEGRFSVLNRPEMKAASLQQIPVACPKEILPDETDLSGEQVIEIIHTVLQTLRQRNEGSLDPNITCRHSRQRPRI